MRRSVFSQSWHNVAQLRPRLLSHTRIFRHVYRGRPWFVIQDTTGSRYHRLSPAAYELVARMDGSTTVQALWDNACRTGGDEVPTQDEIVELLMQLHANDLLYSDVTPDAAELFERYSKRQRLKWKQWLANPLSVKIPLIDPDAFLARSVHRFAWAFSKKGLMIWLAIVIPAVVLAGEHWRELTENMSDRVLAAQNLLLLALVFPVVKALHELGHGFATKAWGGTVHEMGLMFLIFAPIPYVDASASSTFQSKRQRAVVGAAGMLVEVFVAALSLYVWLLVEPGLVRAIAFNVMLIAGISTVIVNGNPLLRFDGYFILSDLLEMPNLAQRGQRYLTYLSDRYLFGARQVEAPDESEGEKVWLVVYTLVSWIYRVFLTLSIVMFIAGEFFIFGVLLALWGAASFFIFPLIKAIRHVRESPALHGQRVRAAKAIAVFVAVLVLFVTIVPMPLRTEAEGVVWLPDEALVRAGAAGFFDKWLVTPGNHAERGTPLVVIHDPLLTAELNAAKARVEEANARYRMQQFTDPTQGQIVLQQLEHERQSLARVQERYDHLTVRSESAGTFTVIEPKDAEGRYFRKGELIGYILERHQLIARVAIDQDNIDLVNARLKRAELRFAYKIPQSYPVSVLRKTPSGIDELPTAALSPAGGGRIPVDPKDPNGLKTLQRIFVVDLKLPDEAYPGQFGGHVYVRFTHQNEPLAHQWYRRIRQLFLSRLHV